MQRQPHDVPVTAGDILNKLLDQYGLKKSFSRHQVAQLWPKIASKPIARHARVERITDRVIHIAVDSSVWMNEMAALKEVLLAKINKSLAPGATKFEDIRFAQRSWGFKYPKPPSKAPEQTLDERDQRTVRSLVDPLVDDSLKSVLTRLIEKDLRLKKQRKASVQPNLTV